MLEHKLFELLSFINPAKFYLNFMISLADTSSFRNRNIRIDKILKEDIHVYSRRKASEQKLQAFVYMRTNAANTNVSGICLIIYLFMVYLTMSVSQKIASNNRTNGEKN